MKNGLKEKPLFSGNALLIAWMSMANIFGDFDKLDLSRSVEGSARSIEDDWRALGADLRSVWVKVRNGSDLCSK